MAEDIPTSPNVSDEAPARAARDAARRSRKLFTFGLVGLSILLAYYSLTAEVDHSLHLYQGLGMIILAVLPSLTWARRGANQLPVFEVAMLTTANTYALPLLNGHEILRSYPLDVVAAAAYAVLLFQAIALVTHILVPGRTGRTPFYTEEIVTRGMQRYVGYGLALSLVYTFVYVFHEDLIPHEFNSMIRAVAYGVGLVSVFVQSLRWGQGQISINERIIFVLMLAAQVLMQFSTLLLVAGVSSIVLALVGYVAGSRRIPLIPVLVILAITALLHNGKGPMRDKYWPEDTEEQQKISVSELVPFYLEWIDHGFRVKQSSGEQELTKKLFDRTSLFHILCLVVSYSPERLPFLEGETYSQIPGQFVPRIIWPDKPRGHVSTYTLAIYYGLQSEDATMRTTIGFGLVSEAYANYGFIGVGALGILLGAFYKKVQTLTASSPLLSYAGLFLVVLMAWSFRTEFTLSIWLSSMFQACVAVIGLPFLVRHLVN